MTKPNVVYLATEGSYSDFHIKAAFSNRKHAEQVGEDVEEHVVYDSVPDKIVVHCIEECWRKADRVRFEYPREWSNVGFPWEQQYTTKPAVVQVDNAEWLRVYGTDKAKVHKVFQDRKAMRVARMEGIA